MIGHLSFGVRDLERAAAFYDPVMTTLGFVRVWSNASALGYGPPGGEDKLALKLREGATPPGPGFHLAFDAPDRAAVDRFHAAALAHGGTDDGVPGLRPHYGPTYYAAFVSDPDGYKLEAVHQQGASADHAASIAAAQNVLDDFMAAFNARDIPAFEATFNFPSVRFASNTMIILNQGDMKPERFTTGALAEWDHSAWERRAVIHAGADKVHIDTRFTRYAKDGSVIGGFDSIYVVTCENGHWGIKCRSSFAP